jgi:hypothetical protein
VRDHARIPEGEYFIGANLVGSGRGNQ